MVYLFHCLSLSPLTLYTSMFIIGIALEQYFAYIFVLLSVITVWLLLLYLITLHTKTVYFICSSFATTGGWHLKHYQSAWNDAAVILSKQKITVQGIVINSTPSLNNPQKSQYTVYITRSSIKNMQNTLLAIYTKKTHRTFKPGETIICKNISCPIPDPHFKQYLMKEGFAASAHLLSSQIKKTYLKPPLWAYCYTVRFGVLKWAHTLFSPSTYALFSSLFLGYKWNEPIEKNREIFSSFKFWGISHYLARSGLHLAILIMLWITLLSYIPLSWYKKQWILIISSLFYFMCTWTSVSFLRALLTFIFGRLFIYFNKPFPLIHIISLTAFSLLIHNPIVLFFLDFQLSFGMTFVLAWLSNLSQVRKTLAK